MVFGSNADACAEYGLRIRRCRSIESHRSLKLSTGAVRRDRSESTRVAIR